MEEKRYLHCAPVCTDAMSRMNQVERLPDGRLFTMGCISKRMDHGVVPDVPREIEKVGIQRLRLPQNSLAPAPNRVRELRFQFRAGVFCCVIPPPACLRQRGAEL